MKKGLFLAIIYFVMAPLALAGQEFTDLAGLIKAKKWRVLLDTSFSEAFR